MILQLKAQYPFTIKLETKDKIEDHSSHPRNLGKGKYDEKDHSIVIVGNNLGNVQITFEAQVPPSFAPPVILVAET